MHGGFRINDWLRRKGYLVLREPPAPPGPFDHARVDWSRTTAWAEGGYYARIFLNVVGREPNGTVRPERMHAVRDELRRDLEYARNDEGVRVPVLVRAPDEYYRRTRGFPPDLMVYFDDLKLRAIGSVGGDRIVVGRRDDYAGVEVQRVNRGEHDRVDEGAGGEGRQVHHRFGRV